MSDEPDPLPSVEPRHLAPADDVPQDVPWQRLSRRMLLVQPVKEVVSSLPAVLGVGIAGFASGRALWGLAVMLVAVAGYGAIRWAVTRYRVTPETAQLKSGIIQRNVTSARLDRIRTVDVTASILHRALGIAAVRIGTGATDTLTLDGLPRERADELARLLDRESTTDRGADSVDARSAGGVPDDERHDEELLAAFDPTWLRFAPFTLSGLVAAAAVVGFFAQAVDEIDWDVALGRADDLLGSAAAAGWWMVGGLGAVAVLVVLTILSVVSYAIAYWGYRLTRHRRGTLRLVRGLLTTRATTIEERRIRGAVLEEPVLLRLVRGGRARLLTTGLPGGDESGGSDLLVPPTNAALAGGVLETVLEAPGVAGVPLRSHGPAATRRRWFRAVVPAIGVAVVLSVAAWWFSLPTPLVAAPAVLVALAVPVAIGRVRALGHVVTDGRLVARSGVFPRRRSVLALSGVIGWTWSSTPFQRRVGLVTTSAMTAAGSGSVEVLDVPEAAGVALAHAADPELLAPFLVPAAGRRSDRHP